MASQDESNSKLNKVEAAVRNALREIQRGCILCVPPSLAERQLEGAVRIAMRHLAQECPELAIHPPLPEGESKDA